MERLRGALVLAVLLAACGHSQVRHYYTLTYPVTAEKGDPLPYTVRVRDLAVPETYGGVELVFRPDIHEIRYYDSRRWSERPQKMLTALVREHLAKSGLVARVVDEIGETPPDFTLTGEVEALEELDAGGQRFGHLAMSLRLVRFSDDQVVWTYRFDDRKPSGDEARGTVTAISRILAERLSAAFADLRQHLGAPQGPATAPAPASAPAPDPGLPATFLEHPDAGPTPELGPDPHSPLLDHPQLLADQTDMPVGSGALFLPALSVGDREPLVAVYSGDRALAEGHPGQRIVVDPGHYTVRVGSGAISQQISVPVRVEAGQVTPVPPTWGALLIEVVDDQFIPFRGTYELIRMEDRSEYGLGFGADELQGEELRTWVLPPGLYKIVRAGGTYRDRTNFATVRLLPGHLTRFTLVEDQATGTFLGAGEVDPEETEGIAVKDWVVQGLIGGDVAFQRSDQIGAEKGWGLTLHVFFDGFTHFRREPHRFVTRLEIEEGQNRAPGDDRFTNVTDRLFFHGIYTYDVVSWFGPYARAGVETKLLARYQDFDTPRDVDEVNEDGDVVKTHHDVDRVRLGGAFSPLQLIQGAGGNFHVLDTRPVALDLRLGFGARQTLANGLLVYDNDVLKPLQDNHSEGVEGTLVLLAHLSRWVTLSSEFDGLLPFARDDASIFTWRNQATVSLLSFLSLAYRFNATRDPNLGLGNDVRTEHDVQLRFSYNLF